MAGALLAVTLRDRRRHQTPAVGAGTGGGGGRAGTAGTGGGGRTRRNGWTGGAGAPGTLRRDRRGQTPCPARSREPVRGTTPSRSCTATARTGAATASARPANAAIRARKHYRNVRRNRVPCEQASPHKTVCVGNAIHRCGDDPCRPISSRPARPRRPRLQRRRLHLHRHDVQRGLHSPGHRPNNCASAARRTPAPAPEGGAGQSSSRRDRGPSRQWS